MPTGLTRAGTYILTAKTCSIPGQQTFNSCVTSGLPLNLSLSKIPFPLNGMMMIVILVRWIATGSNKMIYAKHSLRVLCISKRTTYVLSAIILLLSLKSVFYH